MTARWLREHRADVQITAFLLAGGSLLFGGGIGLGVHIAPVETITITRTITKATPPVCLAALDAGDVGFAQWGIWDAQNGYNLQHTAASFDAQIHGHTDEMLAEQSLANAAAIARDEADFARIGAEQGYQANAERCREATAPVAANRTEVVQ